MLNFPMELPVPPTENDPTPKKGRHRFETNFSPLPTKLPVCSARLFLGRTRGGFVEPGGPDWATKSRPTPTAEVSWLAQGVWGCERW